MFISQETIHFDFSVSSVTFPSCHLDLSYALSHSLLFRMRCRRPLAPFLLMFPWSTLSVTLAQVYWVMSNIWKIQDYLLKLKIISKYARTLIFLMHAYTQKPNWSLIVFTAVSPVIWKAEWLLIAVMEYKSVTPYEQWGSPRLAHLEANMHYFYCIKRHLL